MHFDFTTPKDLKITPSDDKKRERGEQLLAREDKREEKNTETPFNFYTVYFGVSGEK